jgi:hypothetical protein
MGIGEKRLGITYFHETFGNRNKIERWFRELENRTKRFYNNINAKALKSIEEIATAVAVVHNLVRIEGSNTNLTVPNCIKLSKVFNTDLVRAYNILTTPSPVWDRGNGLETQPKIESPVRGNVIPTSPHWQEPSPFRAGRRSVSARREGTQQVRQGLCCTGTLLDHEASVAEAAQLVRSSA